MSKHTPGPWGFAEAERFYERGDIGIHVVREGSADGMLVTVVRDNNMRAMQIANARLIAAAPDLLEACQESLNALFDYVETLEKQGGSMNYGKRVIYGLIAAIAKAEGT